MIDAGATATKHSDALKIANTDQKDTVTSSLAIIATAYTILWMR